MIAAAMMAMLMQASAATQSVGVRGGEPVLAPGATPPTPAGDPGAWVTPDDYPVDALHANIQGMTGFRVTVDQQGNVTSCSITDSSGTASLDETTCKLVKARARFEPSRDSKRRPIRGTWSSRVKWIVPGAPRMSDPPESPNTLVVSYILQADGTHTDCRIDRAEGKANEGSHVGPAPCFGARSNKGYVDAQGKPERRRVTLTVSTTVDPVR